jgi:3-isopropylmalate dehydrogenase
MMLRYSLGRSREAERIEAAVTGALREGFRTADIYTADTRLVGTTEMGRAVLEKL